MGLASTTRMRPVATKRLPTDRSLLCTVLQSTMASHHAHCNTCVVKSAIVIAVVPKGRDAIKINPAVCLENLRGQILTLGR